VETDATRGVILSTHPPGSQPSYGQQPPYGQQPGQPPTGQSPTGPRPPYGPQPEKRKSNPTLIVVIVIVVLALTGGIVGAALLLAGDDDSASSGSETIEGDGYSYAIPGGWEEATSAAGGTQGIDSVVRAKDDQEGFRSNILVEVQPASGTTDPEAIRDTWEANIGAAVGATPEPIDDTTIDGQTALGVRAETTQQGIDVIQVAYLTINDGKVYSIAMSSHADLEEEATGELDQLLDSWSWA
jgi:hypothetical protein